MDCRRFTQGTKAKETVKGLFITFEGNEGSGKGRCERRLYDQHFLLSGSGRTARLHEPMIDDMRMSLEEWTRRHLRWADAQASMAVDGGGEGEIHGRWIGSPIERKRALRRFYGGVPPMLRPFLLFAYRYLFRLGFLDVTLDLALEGGLVDDLLTAHLVGEILEIGVLRLGDHVLLAEHLEEPILDGRLGVFRPDRG